MLGIHRNRGNISQTPQKSRISLTGTALPPVSAGKHSLPPSRNRAGCAAFPHSGKQEPCHRTLARLEEHDFIRREPPLSDKRTAVSFPTDKALAIYPVIMHFVREWDSTVTDILFPGTASSAPLHAATTAYGKSRKHRGSTTLKPCLHSASCDMLCRLFPGQIWTSWNNPA